MTGQQLKNSILQEAIEGRLIPQDPNDEPASVLLERIRAEKARLVKEKKIKKDKNESRIYRTDDGHWMEHFEDKSREDVCIDEEIPFELPSGWELSRLSTICALTDGEKKEGKRVCLDAKFLRGKSTGDYLDKGKYVSLGDNIILVDGENSGEVFTVPCNGYMGSTFKQLLTNKEMFLPYVLFFLMSYKDLLRKSKKGAAIPHLNKDIFYSLIIGIPPLAEQHRIVEKIESLLPKVEAYGKAQEELVKLTEVLPEQLKKSILQEAIEGRLVPQDPNDEPASVLLERIRTEKARLVKEKKIKKDKNESHIYRTDDGHWMEHFEDKNREDICIDEEIPFEVPSGWEWCRLISYLDVRDGTHDSPKYYNQGIPFVTSKNLKNGEIDFSSCKLISDNDHKKFSERSCVDDGDILFAMIGSIGNPVIVKKDREFSIKNVALFKRYNDEVTYNKYIYYYLEYVQDELKKIASGGVQSFIGLNTFRSLLFPLPPLAEQHRIVEKIESLLPKIEKLKVNQ